MRESQIVAFYPFECESICNLRPLSSSLILIELENSFVKTQTTPIDPSLKDWIKIMSLPTVLTKGGQGENWNLKTSAGNDHFHF